MNAEYIEFHLKEILTNCHEGERQRAIDWVKDFVREIERGKNGDSTLS